MSAVESPFQTLERVVRLVALPEATERLERAFAAAQAPAGIVGHLLEPLKLLSGHRHRVETQLAAAGDALRQGSETVARALVTFALTGHRQVAVLHEAVDLRRAAIAEATGEVAGWRALQAEKARLVDRLDGAAERHNAIETNAIAASGVAVMYPGLVVVPRRTPREALVESIDEIAVQADALLGRLSGPAFAPTVAAAHSEIAALRSANAGGTAALAQTVPVLARLAAALAPADRLLAGHEAAAVSQARAADAALRGMEAALVQPLLLQEFSAGLVGPHVVDLARARVALTRCAPLPGLEAPAAAQPAPSRRPPLFRP